MKKRLAVLLAVAVAAAMLLAGCGGKTTRTLRVGVRGDVVNFSYQDPDSGRFYGAEVDLAQALAEQLGYTDVAFTRLYADEREGALQNGTVDCVIACYSITPERLEILDMAPYYNSATRVMVENTTGFADLADLAGANIGVVDGTSNALELATELAARGVIDAFDAAHFDAATFDGGVRFTVLESYPALDDAVEVGSVDAACIDSAIATGYMSGSRLLLEGEFAQEDYGVATLKGSALSEPIAEALEVLTNDATLSVITSKWM